jgi:hypothetical protein
MQPTPTASLTLPPPSPVKTPPNAVAFARIGHQHRQLKAIKPPRSTGVLKSKMTSLSKLKLTYQKRTCLLKLKLTYQKRTCQLKLKLTYKKRTSP